MNNQIILVRGNTYVIDTGMSYIPFYRINEEEIVMLDSGWAHERDIIDKVLEENNFKVAGIINSHAHVDHVGNNAYLKRKYLSVIAMSSHEAVICSSAVSLKVYYSNINLSMVEDHMKEMICDTDIIITDDQNKIYVCGIKFGIIHTPGHSPAHICIITPDNVAYVGDCLITDEVMKGAKMPYAYILKKDIKSKQDLHNLDCNKYIVAHKGIFDNIHELIDENIKFYTSRAEAVKNVMHGKMTREEILRAVMKEFNINIKPENIFRFFVIDRMVKCYIDYLAETGEIEIIVDDGFAKYYIKDEK